MKKRQPGLLDEFIKLRQERTMKDDNQRFLVYDKAKKHRGPFRKLSVSFQRTNPNMFFFSFQTQHGTVSTTPRGLWSMGQDRQRSGNHLAATFSCCLGIGGCGDLTQTAQIRRNNGDGHFGIIGERRGRTCDQKTIGYNWDTQRNPLVKSKSQ